MKTFQKIFLLVLATGFSSYALAQNATDPPIGVANGTVPATQPNTSLAWFRGGNTNAGNGGTNNVFGTNFNDPIYTITSGVLRTKLNSSYTTVSQYPINGFFWNQGVNKSGNMLISTNNLSNLYTAKGPFSMLHLNGGSTTNGTTFVQEGGWRTWMDVGVTFTSNQDLGYIGHRQIGLGTDKTEMVINWSDNSGGGSGPDVCTFRFTAGNGVANNDLNGDALAGREIMRLLGDGNVGIGPRFSSTGNEPTSLLHLNSENSTDAWLQISNQGIQPATYSQFSGLRIGILGQPIANRNGNAFIYNQENRHLIFSTNSPTPSNMNNTLERVRITSVNAPTDLPVTGYGIYNPGALGVNDTRVAISLFTGAPVTRPLSLLHLGLNAGTATPTLGTDGWRPWMENGMFVSSGSDHIFMGMKLRQGTALPMDSYDAVIGWGDNQPASAPAGSGPDNLRFIFTANPNSTGATAPATNANGVEAMRMTPLANTVYVGIGDDNNNAYSAAGQPGNTLEINSTANGAAIANAGGGTGFSGLRFTDLNSTSTTYTSNPGTGVLSVNANGDVIYVPGGGGSPFGGACGNTNNMTSNFEIPMNNQNYVWSGQGTTGNNVGIGIPAAGCTPIAKLDVRQVSGFIPPANTTGSIAIATRNADKDGIAIKAVSTGVASAQQTKVAGWFESPPSAGSTQVAIFVPSNGGQVLVGYTYPHLSNNMVDVAGSVASNGNPLLSDVSLKHNVISLGTSMDKINSLRPVTFEWNTVLDSAMNGTHAGFIAQEVDTVIPEVVRTGADSLKTVAYTELIPYLVKAIQEQNIKIDSLENQLKSCCSSTARTQNPSTNQTDVVLDNSQNIVLLQNVPNPFAEQTTISYNLPESIQKAQLLFYDATGKLIKAVDLTDRGKGQVNVFANDLSNGIYSYALIADGQIADTKRMVKTN